MQFFTPQGQIGIGTGPSARIYGLDLDFEARPVSHVRLFGGLSIVRGKFGRYPSALLSIPIPGGGNNQVIGDATGNQLPFTSRFSGNIGGEYSIPLSDGSIGINANLYHNSGFYSETDNIRRQPAYEQVSASIGWASRDDRLSIRVWGRNLTNAAVVTQLSASPQGVGASFQPPRTYGVTVGSKF